MSFKSRILNFFYKFEVYESCLQSWPEFIKAIQKHQLDVFAWLIANIFISYITTFWLQALSSNSLISSKDILNTSYVIFVNAFLFSLLPVLDTNGDKKKEFISLSMRYLNILSIAIAIFIPFLFYLQFSFLSNCIIALILMLSSFVHFIFQNYYSDHPYERTTNPALASDSLPSTARSGGRDAS